MAALRSMRNFTFFIFIRAVRFSNTSKDHPLLQVYAVTFNGPGGEVSYRNRWVQTDRFKKQERSGRDEIVGKAVWTESSGGWLANLGPPGNPSNTRSVGGVSETLWSVLGDRCGRVVCLVRLSSTFVSFINIENRLWARRLRMWAIEFRTYAPLETRSKRFGTFVWID
jgi:hypothetical protein